MTGQQALLRGDTYKVFSDSACQDFQGWYPLVLPHFGGFTVFSYSYLADTTSAAFGGMPSGEAVAAALSRTLVVTGSLVRLRRPG